MGELELFNDLMPHGLTDPAQRGLTEVIYCVREDIFYCVVSYFTPLPRKSRTSRMVGILQTRGGGNYINASI